MNGGKLLLIGLGTPSTSASAPTAFVRHNAGQKFVEWVAKRERISEFWRHSSACSGSITESDRVVLFRPSASRMDQRSEGGEGKNEGKGGGGGRRRKKG
uniref:Peptidyl-tRNA hydrolase n=1 Tax=Chromera velia CCMP2878 TaxID=1169474 RepID=A0A0G4GY95_9ALVE|eukprot:Cvel_23893.t1-p1 / transcript=Cvel_23893.t1 / gene=Cvel_23893 / organism=Chromera_velia_CCMP2878 / gene_product=hypothetical protein / transcript_product=hypothetical protein / location=Cvel_scaffold2518:16-718(-) / protein_length=98 / sequence_SO=supercontig / SO=protein_coding / is_pseudo=false